MVGVNPEMAHEHMAGLNFSHGVAQAIEAGKLFHIDLNDQAFGRYDQDFRFGAVNLKSAFFLVKLLEDYGYSGCRHFDAHAYRTEDYEGVKDFARGCMRTYLILKDKARSVVNSMRILKARKQALIKEFLETTRPFLRSGAEIRNIYGKAIQELILSLGHEGQDFIESIRAATARDFRVEITEKSIWGLKYKEVTAPEPAVRDPGRRGYDFLSTTPHLEESIYLFEKIMESMVEMAAFEQAEADRRRDHQDVPEDQGA
jgi:hypothetical protein